MTSQLQRKALIFNVNNSHFVNGNFHFFVSTFFDFRKDDNTGTFTPTMHQCWKSSFLVNSSQIRIVDHWLLLDQLIINHHWVHHLRIQRDIKVTRRLFVKNVSKYEGKYSLYIFFFLAKCGLFEKRNYKKKNLYKNLIFIWNACKFIYFYIRALNNYNFSKKCFAFFGYTVVSASSSNGPRETEN